MKNVKSLALNQLLVSLQRVMLLPALALTACGGMGGGGVPTEVSTSTQTSPPASGGTDIAVPSDYSLVWSDEFSENGLPNPSKWNYDTERNKLGWYNNEKQYYSSARLENSEVRDGKLIISARKEQMSQQTDWGGQSYSSARLITAGKAEWVYGFFEVRAKLPCGQGTWPAIWTLGSGQSGWPAFGELDIMEWVGSAPTRVFSTVHTTSGSGGNGSGGATQIQDACNTFHLYQMHWTPQQIRFGMDGKIHHTYVNAKQGVAQWPFDTPQYLILNIAIGGDLGGTVDNSIFPTNMEIDYVRVYQQRP